MADHEISLSETTPIPSGLALLFSTATDVLKSQTRLSKIEQMWRGSIDIFIWRRGDCLDASTAILRVTIPYFGPYNLT